MSDIRLILVDPKPGLCDAFRKAFQELPNVEVVQGYFQQIPVFDCMVSAANSFGLMDGGVDAAIIQFFGPELENRVQTRIITEYLGEQPVGTSMIVQTDHPKHPYIAHTPTMRIPMDISKTDNVYTAMWAMLVAVERHNRTTNSPIHTIACPGLGTATGRVPPMRAAKQMALAYQNFLTPPRYITWDFASSRQVDIWKINPPLS